MEYLDKTGLAHFWGKAKTKIEASSINKVYPVGSIYMSVSSTSPASLFGGTWEQINSRFLLASGEAHDEEGNHYFYEIGDAGGEINHKLTVNEMPSHRHSSDSYQNGYPNYSYMAETNNYCTWVNKGAGGAANAPAQGENGFVRTSYIGGNFPHNNMPPYLVVNMWKRTA